MFTQAWPRAPGPASSRWGLFPGAPCYLAHLKVRPGACSTSRGPSLLFLLLSCLTARGVKAIGSNIQLAKWREGPGRQVDGPISQLERLRWSITQRQGNDSGRSPT